MHSCGHTFCRPTNQKNKSLYSIPRVFMRIIIFRSRVWGEDTSVCCSPLLQRFFFFFLFKQSFEGGLLFYCYPIQHRLIVRHSLLVSGLIPGSVCRQLLLRGLLPGQPFSFTSKVPVVSDNWICWSLFLDELGKFFLKPPRTTCGDVGAVWPFYFKVFWLNYFLQFSSCCPWWVFSHSILLTVH